jgi:predicted GNAT family acetyltransferase
MRAHRCRSAADFLDRAGEFLCRHEARNSLPLGLATTILDNPARYAEQYEGAPFFGVVEEGGQVVSAAVRTPPAGVVIAGTDKPAAIAVLARLVHGKYRTLPGMNATGEDAAAFVDAWQRLTGQVAMVEMRQRIYACSRVRAIALAAGSLRPAAASDLELLVSWYADFMREALGEEDPEEHARTIVDVRLRHASSTAAFRIWEDEDGVPASLVGFGRATPRGICIAPVWTPPERRRRGFGTAATAATTRELLGTGREFVCLFTDLGNRTSNRIYRAIGYKPVCGADQWMFAHPTRGR